MTKAIILKKAIIPVAGLETRMLPATKAIPKELLPILDRPIIEYVVKEAIDAGMNPDLLPRPFIPRIHFGLGYPF